MMTSILNKKPSNESGTRIEKPSTQPSPISRVCLTCDIQRKEAHTPPFRSLKSGDPPSTFPPSGTSSSSMTPDAGAGTCTDVWKYKIHIYMFFFV